MSTQKSTAAYRLCVFCRRVEPTSQPCPYLQGHAASPRNGPLKPLDITAQFSKEEAAMLEGLQRQPSSLCQRCSAYNIVEVFRSSEPLDAEAKLLLNEQEYSDHLRHIEQVRLELGKFSQLHLTPSCQLCRLIYRILPKGSVNPDDEITLAPVRSHVRLPGWELLPADVRYQSAIFLTIRTLDHITLVSRPFVMGGPRVRLAEATGAAIALHFSQTLPDRKYLNAQVIQGLLDYSLIRKALEDCESSHGSWCQRSWPAEMATTLMLDVIDRKIVPCPDRCNYVALSYVWGGVMPAADALSNGTLPRTIEDVIMVTKNLGRRYLWIDALCINQNPVLTPDEARLKVQQLSIMHLIYQSAALTVVALSGHDSNWGLAGVSHKFERARQPKETIDGHGFFTVPLQPGTEMDNSVWLSRAWTLQEEFFSSRTLFLSDNQAYYQCGSFAIPESDDINTYPPSWGTIRHPYNELLFTTVKGIGSQPDGNDNAPSPLTIFSGFINRYTARRMTNEGDAINACLGMLTMMERRLFKTGFVHGLPLHSHPQTLGWMHDHKSSPKHRKAFPSWTWAGWEGELLFPNHLLVDAEEYGIQIPRQDLTVQFIAVNGNEITVEGFVVELDIRTEPFSEVFVVGNDEAIGSVTENNSLHNTTIPTGIYKCLIIQRIKFRMTNSPREREHTFMLLLDWQGPDLAKRKSLATMIDFAGGSIMQAKPEKRVIKLI